MSREFIEQLKRHEGFREHVYECSAGKQTIGFGFNIEAGISKNNAEALLQSQVAEIWLQCDAEFRQWWFKIGQVRQGVILNMVFNLGMRGLKKFKKMLAAIHNNDHEEVVKQMLDSKWAHQVGKRSYELADQWRENEWQDVK